jgi:hypothetical protein
MRGAEKVVVRALISGDPVFLSNEARIKGYSYKAPTY